jgi:branched-chain amino acid aminotransferase
MACIADYFLIDNQTLSTKHFDIGVLEKGISIYEVVKIINKKPLFLEDHLERFAYSAGIKNLHIKISNEFIKNNIRKLVEINNIQNGRLKFALRFHESGDKLLCFFLENIEPKTEVYKKGIKLIPKVHERKSPNAKVINYDLRKAVKKLIIKKKAFETLLINRSGKVTECSKSNIFFIKDKTIYTAKESDVLKGVTRKYVFEICSDKGIQIIEKDIMYDEITDYDSVFISGTSIGILGVNHINGKTFKMDHPVLKLISESYTALTESYIQNFSYSSRVA